jgi:8-oxo-dGTP pyrophosphatase MutT (NUDIX family)
MQKSQRVSSTPRSRREPSTVVAWITDSEGNVLVLRKRDDAFFSEPGGKVEPGETLEQTVIREVLQETGLNLPAISTDNGHKTVQQWVVFQASLTGERPTVVSQSEYSDGEAVWIKPEDIVITTPPGGSCACSGCDAMTAKTKLFYFQRPNSHVWICPTCKPEYEGRAGYTLKIRAGYRLTKTMQATMVTDARPGMGIRAAGEVISFNRA